MADTMNMTHTTIHFMAVVGRLRMTLEAMTGPIHPVRVTTTAIFLSYLGLSES